MEVREELKEIIERARAAAEAAGELPPGEICACAAPGNTESEGVRRLFHQCGHAVGKDGAHKAPRAIAESIVKYIDAPLVSKMEIAGAGFINFFLAADTVYAELRNILSAALLTEIFRKIKRTRFLWNMCLPILQDRSISGTPAARLMVLLW